MVFFKKRILGLLFPACALVLGACSNKGGDAAAPDSGLLHVRLQTDWFPQGEHGGFYYALAKGYYRQEGLDVEILPGGLTYMGALKLTEGQADFAMNKAESILRHVDQGMPLRIVMATLQHDPQAVMMHAESPVQDFKDLDGRQIIAMPGGTWLSFLERKYGVQPIIIPSDKGMERFLSSPDVLQQCMVTCEPYYALRHGVETRTLLLSKSGFDSYHIVATSEKFAAEHPEAVQAFIRASIRGWVDYLTKDPTPAFDLIKARNPRQSDSLLNYARKELVDGGYAFGTGRSCDYGLISDARMEALASQLLDLGIISKMPDRSVWSLAPSAR